VSTPLVIISCDRFGGDVFSLIEVLESSASLLGPTGFISDVSSAADLDRVDALRSQVVGSVDDPTRRTEPFTGGLATGSGEVVTTR